MLSPLLIGPQFPASWPKVFHFETTRCDTCLVDVGDQPFVSPDCSYLFQTFRKNPFLELDGEDTRELLNALERRVNGKSMMKRRQDPSMPGGRLDTAVIERTRLAVASNYIVTTARIQDEIDRRVAETGYSATASEDMLGVSLDAPSITLKGNAAY